MNAWHSLASCYLYHMKGLYYKCLMLRNLVKRESNHIPDLESFRFWLLIPRFGVNVCVSVCQRFRSQPQESSSSVPTLVGFFFFPGRVSHWSEVCQGGHSGRWSVSLEEHSQLPSSIPNSSCEFQGLKSVPPACPPSASPTESPAKPLGKK